MSILSSIEKQKISLRYWLLGRNYITALKALEFANSYHVGVRKDGVTPEFHHQIAITNYVRTLPNLCDEEAILTACLLHDVAEDYDVSHEDIRKLVGQHIADSVYVLNKKNAASINQYFDYISDCRIASVVKGADRIHNHQTMSGVFSKDKQANYIEETEIYILPMLKTARRKFPEQDMAYENIKHVLKTQIELIKLSLGK